MVLRVVIQQAPNHGLVGGAVLLGLALEKVHAPLGQGERDLHPFLAKGQFAWRREEIRDDADLPDRPRGVRDALIGGRCIIKYYSYNAT